MLKQICSIIFVSFFALCTSVSAYNQNPNLNWGNTNIIDGMFPPPGIYMSNYMVYYHSDKFTDHNGDDLKPLGMDLDNELDVFVECPQVFSVSKSKLPGGLTYGFQALLPIQNISLDSTLETPGGDMDFFTSNSMIGDLCVGPWIGKHMQFANGWGFHWFFEFDTYIPIGDYEKENQINPSANYWTIEPFFAFTLQMPKGLTLSMRHHYTYNFENDDYQVFGGPLDGQTVDMQAGSMYHFNYSFMKTLDFIDPMLRFGIVGYYGTQLEEDEIDDQDLDNSKEEIFAIGPALHYIYKGTVLSLKTYFESGAENRPEGERITFRMIYRF